jgi:hypothetical protein
MLSLNNIEKQHIIEIWGVRSPGNPTPKKTNRMSWEMKKINTWFLTPTEQL